mmetsp:Transcript_20035/g.28681  ORF Transcript_20035/g.28681 Transcript_20035/m.28681 type:complete len:439 (+) Transcript_20035:36-1352(+)
MSAPTSSSTSASIVQSQQILEKNEDIIAAIVENLQLGRLDDCMKHYTILQSNLVSLAEELDNFPAGDTDPYEALYSFPDEIMRKDVLEELQPYVSRPLPRPPVVPACSHCAANNISAEMCRFEYLHLQPSSKFTATEREEFIHAVQSLAARNCHAEGEKQKRNYKRWNWNERYSLLIGIKLFGSNNVHELVKILENRSPNQIRTFMNKNVKKVSSLPSLLDLLSKPPKGYQPPRALAPIFSEYAATGAVNTNFNLGPLIPSTTSNGYLTSSLHGLKPRFSGHDFCSLISLAAGVPSYILNPHSGMTINTGLHYQPQPQMISNTDNAIYGQPFYQPSTGNNKSHNDHNSNSSSSGSSSGTAPYNSEDNQLLNAQIVDTILNSTTSNSSSISNNNVGRSIAVIPEAASKEITKGKHIFPPPFAKQGIVRLKQMQQQKKST